ncbi:caspase family protein [Bradyrhizobium japonicum]|uniref:caspase family protein n=1 Tax=Bradyrhizobium japonicum TaxID=375 RepID=UPI0004B06069|nr:caspase family protein [Bradyrhizobium japonicum]MBR0733855.1 caspase family protein [Bradyrhizobium japonicum]MBR0747007.1 caspase family protein [Bradyrhizobium japonicum]MBR0808822.1 caspase family protein [Bradyrhizobium japonicum]MCP1763285.1 tetratricopeptide (TPR) repeat protein [Bradyrhizobium japonicum]MCP1785419.1 tetratricopeptide (TPR) repeat protein [Bradyrhizobium japonicum]
MLRVIPLTLAILISNAAIAAAEPQAGDDLATCRDRQAEAQARATACDNLLKADKLGGKDKSLALVVRGNALINKRDYDRAIEALSSAIDLDPDNVGAINLRGLSHERKGEDDLAMADYNLAIQKRANFGYAYNNRGTIHLRRGALQSALDDFNLSIKYTPAFLLGWTNRARMRTLNKDFDGAIADFAAAEKIDPAAPQIAGNRCITYGMMGKYDQAFADCDGLIQKQPRNTFAINNRAEVNVMKGDLDAALKDYNTVIQLNPNSVRAHSGRGQIYERRKDLAQARADYRAAAYSLTRFDEPDVARARAIAQERLAALTPQAPAGSTGRRVALVIGNGAYKNVHALPNPPRDAKMIANVLRDVGFQTVISVSDLSRDKFFEALQSFATEAENADWAVVYYAGHGFEIGGVNYLVPVDAKLAADRDAETQAVALEQVIAAVGAARKVRLVMLDACRDNPFAPTMQRTLSLKLVDKGFSNIEPGAGFMVVYAAKHGETALDGDGGADSPFATALAREIKVPKVEIRKLFDIVRDDVWSATKHEQQPFSYGSPPGREDFYFVAGK